MTTIERRTRETQVTVSTAAPAGARFETSVPFLDHMLRTLACYSRLPLTVIAQGDLKHHIIEDVAITTGEWVRQCVGSNIVRYADRAVVMDEAWVQCALDVGGRAYYEGSLPSSLYDHWMRSFAMNAACTLHLRVVRGRDRHHVIEAAFKSLGLCLHDALAAAAPDERDAANGVSSTKGVVTLRRT